MVQNCWVYKMELKNNGMRVTHERRVNSARKNMMKHGNYESYAMNVKCALKAAVLTNYLRSALRPTAVLRF